jgi:hypothetical protein
MNEEEIIRLIQKSSYLEMENLRLHCENLRLGVLRE